MKEILALLFTLALGLFLFVGAFIVFISKNNEKFITYSISLAFVVMIMILFMDIIKESYELLGGNGQAIIYLIIFSLVGLILLKVIDHFIPDHHDDPTTHLDDDKNMAHIGLMSSIALIIHNVLEGMAVYSSMISSLSKGSLIALGVGLHNIPLGMIITSTFYKANNNKLKTLLIILIISLSTFFGGVILYLFNKAIELHFLNGMFLSLTIGMILYICIFELLPKIINTENKKMTILGIVSGILLFGLTLFL